MPEGYYGNFIRDGKEHTVVFFSTFKPECLRRAKIYRGEGSNAKVIRWPIKMGTLAGGVVEEHWAVAISRKRAPGVTRPFTKEEVRRGAIAFHDPTEAAMRRHHENMGPFG